MTETTSASHRPSAPAASASLKTRYFRLVASGILCALAVAVVLLRFHRLSELPPGLDAGEGANGIDALRVLQGEHSVFFPELLGGREGLVMYLTAFSIFLFGRTELALRLPTVLVGASTVFVVFWLGQLLFGRDEETGHASTWRGIVVGAAGAGLMAVSLSQTIMGRAAFRANLLPVVLCLCLAFLWQGWRQRERGGGTWWLIVLAGFWAGLLPYTYLAARFVPFLLLFYGLSFLLPLRGVTLDIDGAASQPKGIPAALHRLRAEMPRIGVFVGVAGLVVAPLLIYFISHPDHFLLRSKYLSVFHVGQDQGDPFGTFLVNVWDHLLAFGFRGDPIWRHNFAVRPMLNPVEALFFWLGVGVAIRRWQGPPAYRLLLLWLFTMILPAVLSRDYAPYTLRMIGAAPAIYLIIGVGMWGAFRFLYQRFSWAKERVAAIGLGSVLCLLLLVQGVNTHRVYFQDWADAPETYAAYETNWTELARALDSQPAAKDTVYLIPGYTWFSRYWWLTSFQYLYQGTTPTQIVSVGAFNMAPAVESTLAAMEDISAVIFVDWDNDIVGGDARADEQIAHLLGKYGRYQGSEEGPSFRIHSYTDINLDRPWTSYERLEPLEVKYDGGITLHGFALGQGTNQFSSRQPFTLGQDERAKWVVMQWESAPGLEVEYSISLRLHSAEGDLLHQQDAVLRDPNTVTTKNWSAGERIDTLHYLELPADLAPGEYEMRLVVYDFATLKPTVEISVWEPETVLARPLLEDAQ